MNEQEYIKQRLEDQIKWYDVKSQSNQKWYKGLKSLEIILSVTIPFLSGLIDKSPMLLPILIGILGIVIAIIEGILYLFRFKENWTEYRIAAESLRREKVLYLTKSGPYLKNATLQMLVERVEMYTEQENKAWLMSGRKKEDEEEV